MNRNHLSQDGPTEPARHKNENSSKSGGRRRRFGRFAVNLITPSVGASWSIRLVPENTTMIRSRVVLMILGPALAGLRGRGRSRR